MLKTIRSVFKIKELRTKILYTFMVLVIAHPGSQLPIPGVETSLFANRFAEQTTNVSGFFNAMTGGPFSSIFIFVLSITSYITSSIIIQLLTIVIPRLEELQKDGENGRKEVQEYTRYTTVGLVLIEPSAMVIGFGHQGLLTNCNAWNIIIAIVTMIMGSAPSMWISEQIMGKDVRNGISTVLLFNTLPGMPDDMKTLYYRFIFGRTVTKMIFGVVVIVLTILAMVVFVVVLNDTKRKIPAQYLKKMAGRRIVSGQAPSTPLKINTIGVMPVIFVFSIMSLPMVVSQFLTIDPNSIGSETPMMLNSGSWCRPEYPIYSIDLVIYIALPIISVYSYTSITFNPLGVANNMKKQGGFIPGTRPDKLTNDYLNKILNYIVFTGVCGLIMITITPVLASGLLDINRISFSGTSLIIIVGVVLETIKAIEPQMLVCYYKGFLDD